MAKAKSEVKEEIKTISVALKEQKITIELSLLEAYALLVVVQNIGGCPDTSLRGLFSGKRGGRETLQEELSRILPTSLADISLPDGLVTRGLSFTDGSLWSLERKITELGLDGAGHDPLNIASAQYELQRQTWLRRGTLAPVGLSPSVKLAGDGQTLTDMLIDERDGAGEL